MVDIWYTYLECVGESRHPSGTGTLHAEHCGCFCNVHSSSFLLRSNGTYLNTLVKRMGLAYKEAMSTPSQEISKDVVIRPFILSRKKGRGTSGNVLLGSKQKVVENHFFSAFLHVSLEAVAQMLPTDTFWIWRTQLEYDAKFPEKMKSMRWPFNNTVLTH